MAQDTHPARRLGRRPPKRAATLNASEFVTLPARPLVDVSPRLDYPMDKNDVAGVCVVAGWDHFRQCVAALLGVPYENLSDADLLRLYQEQNPGFRSFADAGGPDDNGMDIQTFLEARVADGSILGFGKVDLNEDALKAAIWVGLGVITGETLTTAQQSQEVWDYDPEADLWGGHCTVSVSFDEDRQGVVTWGELVEVTDLFVRRQVEEAWFVLTRDHIEHAGFRNHFDLAGFSAAVATLTDGKVVVPVPPVPVPEPTPAPLPDPLEGFPFKELDEWAERPHWFRRATAAARAYRAWRARQR